MATKKKFEAILQFGGNFLPSWKTVFDKADARMKSTAQEIRDVKKLQAELTREIKRTGEAGAGIDKLKQRYASLQTTLQRLQTQQAANRREYQRELDLQKKAAQFRTSMKYGAAATAAVGAAGTAAVFRAMPYDKKLMSIAVTGEERNENNAGAYAQQLRAEISKQSQATGQAQDALADGMHFLVSAGMDKKKAMDNIGLLGRMATATGGEMRDLAEVLFAVQSNAGVRAGADSAYAMDSLATAGKLGAFELKDMAGKVPGLLAQLQGRGVVGLESVNMIGPMLQIARRMKGGEAGGAEAATIVSDFLGKMDSSEALSGAKKHLKVDLNKEIAKQMEATGQNRVIAALEVMDRLTGGDLQKIRQIYADKEVSTFAQAWSMHKNGKGDQLGFFDMQRKTSNRAEVTGLIEKDAATMRTTAQQKWDEVKNASDRAASAVGNTLTGAFDKLLDVLNPTVTAVESMAKNYPTATGIGAGALGLAGAAATSAFGFRWLAAAASGTGAGAVAGGLAAGITKVLAAPAVMAAAAVAVGGAVGTGIGTIVRKSLLEGTETDNNIGRGVARVAAFFGNSNAKEALAAEARVKAAGGPLPTLPPLPKIPLPPLTAAAPQHNTFHITQLPGESGEALAKRIAGHAVAAKYPGIKLEAPMQDR